MSLIYWSLIALSNPWAQTCHVITLKEQLVCYSEIYICICDSSLVCSKWTLQVPLIYTVLCKRIQTLNQTDFIEIYIHWCFVEFSLHKFSDIYQRRMMVATSCRRDAFNQHLVKKERNMQSKIQENIAKKKVSRIYLYYLTLKSHIKRFNLAF